MNISEYKSAGEWHSKLKEEGYLIPPEAGRILTTLMKRYNLSFFDAYNRAINDGGIVLQDKMYFAHIGYLNKLLGKT